LAVAGSESELQPRTVAQLSKVDAAFLRSYKVHRARLVLDYYLKVTPRNGKYDLMTREARLEFERKFATISIRQKAPNVE
jgi:hypothetical protein